MTVFHTAREMHIAPWELDPELPAGGAWWLARAGLFSTVINEVQKYHQQVNTPPPPPPNR